MDLIFFTKISLFYSIFQQLIEVHFFKFVISIGKAELQGGEDTERHRERERRSSVCWVTY